LWYSKAIECSCPENVRSAEKKYSVRIQAEINHIVQAHGYDELVCACYCFSACPSMFTAHLIASVVLSTESQLDDVSKLHSLLRTERHCPEFVS
jgi:hypothetical protein